MPTDEQMRGYADALPPIYREILTAFPRIEPTRRQGYGLAFQTLAADFENRDVPFNLGEILQAGQELERNGLVEIKNRIFVHPTALGERLIALLIGQQGPAVKVDPLPALPK
jgi:hypothetical protein